MRALSVLLLLVLVMTEKYARARKRAFSAIGSAKTTAPLLAAVVSGADVELPRRQFIIKEKGGSPAPRDLPLPPDLAFGPSPPHIGVDRRGGGSSGGRQGIERGRMVRIGRIASVYILKFGQKKQQSIDPAGPPLILRKLDWTAGQCIEAQCGSRLR